MLETYISGAGGIADVKVVDAGTAQATPGYMPSGGFSPSDTIVLSVDGNGAVIATGRVPAARNTRSVGVALPAALDAAAGAQKAAGELRDLDAFRLALRTQLQQMQQRNGEGFRLLTGRVTSPTLLRQIGDLLQKFPKAAWHAYEPIDEDNAAAGAALAFGKRLGFCPHLDKARVLVALDADPLGQGPSQLSNARGFAARRRPQHDEFSRIYSIETAPTLTGAKADHRIALQPQLISEMAIAIARSMGAPIREASLPDQAMRLAKQAAADLSTNHGAAVVLAGRSLPPETHALVHWINAQVQATIDTIEIGQTPDGRGPGTLAELVHDLDAGTVDQLVTMGANPGYDAAADLEFTKRSAKAVFRVHLGRYADETADLATWHVPQTHELEAWSDLRSSDGTASLVQPLIRPLFRSWTAARTAGTADGPRRCLALRSGP